MISKPLRIAKHLLLSVTKICYYHSFRKTQFIASAKFTCICPKVHIQPNNFLFESLPLQYSGISANNLIDNTC